MSHTKFLNLPSNFRLSPNDPAVQRITAQGYLTGDIGLLNPQAPYIALNDTSIPMGSKIIVTNERTGYQEVAIVVDRGPSAPGVMDMSPGMEERMGNGNDTVSYAIASDQSVPPGATDGTPIPYDQPINTVDSSGRTVGFGSSLSSLSPGGSGNYPAGVGAWVERPEENICYKHMGGPGGSSQYDNVETCNSGFRCIPTDKDRCGQQQFVKACGKRPTTSGGNDLTANGCEEEAMRRQGKSTSGGGAYACLWLACKSGNNAIWDNETKRCGCDDGKGGLGNTSNSSNALSPGEGEGGGPEDAGRGTEPTQDPGRIGGSSNQDKLDDFNEQQKIANTKARVVLKSNSVNIDADSWNTVYGYVDSNRYLRQHSDEL